MEIINIHTKTLERLCQKYSVKRMYVFGSVTTPLFTQESDLDFLIDFDDKLDFATYTNNFFLLQEELSNLFHRKIDLITEKSLRNPYLIESINASKKMIYGSE